MLGDNVAACRQMPPGVGIAKLGGETTQQENAGKRDQRGPKPLRGPHQPRFPAPSNAFAMANQAGLRLIIAIERKDAHGFAIVATLLVGKPGVLVGEAPGEHGVHGGFLKRGSQVALVDGGDGAVALGSVRGQRLIGDIEFGNQDR